MFQIDRMGRKPIYEQIIEQTELMIASGVLKPGDQLPSVRALSQMLSANPNTLQKAYAELEREGITTSAPGNGRFIGKDAQGADQGADAFAVRRHRASVRRSSTPRASRSSRLLDAVERGYEADLSTVTHAEKGQTT